ncbi:MAG: hypothetical protein JOZ69_02945, partial [Myxococcales bacterium]|nr:hypothetical protein [Myxococcales bacterium]
MNTRFRAIVAAAPLFFAAPLLGSVALAAGPAKPTKQQCVGANESAQDLRRSGKLHEARTNLATCLSTTCPRLVR